MIAGLREVEAPDVPEGHVRVAVRFAGVNRADLLQRLGMYPAPPGAPPDVPGLEYAGVIEAAGKGARRFAPGDRVFGLVPGGAYAERIVAHEREVAPVPDGLSYDALVTRARLAPGERVLVHAVGSGVGTAGLQIARALGCFVAGTSRTQDKLDRCRELGLDAGIAASSGKFADEVLKATRGAGVDAVLDLVGGAYVNEDLKACASRARIALVGLTAGGSAELDLRELLRKRIELIGTVLRSRPLEEKIAAAQVLERNISPWLARRAVRPIVDRVFPLGEAAAAHDYVASNASFGKVLLRLDA